MIDWCKCDVVEGDNRECKYHSNVIRLVHWAGITSPPIEDPSQFECGHRVGNYIARWYPPLARRDKARGACYWTWERVR